MITREFGPAWKAACISAPPPLHVYSPQAEHAAWHPLRPADVAPAVPGPVVVHIPAPAGAALGEDPTDPASHSRPRWATRGMFARLHEGEGL